MKTYRDLIKNVDYRENVRTKLRADGIGITEYRKAIRCLKQTVCPDLCIAIYQDIYEKGRYL